ncbi:carbonic anhydrase [Rubellicoccus peritrichatus]|uniref:carbonic anhydrase n=1 Tax=Rubellicoccus peritrichatus TaxID=3080537 RepID=A0AAQ3QV59_9BACT|nr:carbonic anhydrase [Puniceicoccus sp. CR14]WOO40562.1 carbonic anhydrase [Puniceicoccus sp. CR14]
MEPVTPSTALKKVFHGNNQFVQKQDHEKFEAYENEQHPSITLLTCCDSRVQGSVFGLDPIDQFFSIRNIGNQLTAATGSIDYGVRNLQTPLLLILGHTRCGAVKAAMGDYRNESMQIIQELNGLHISLMDVDSASDKEAAWLHAVEKNVDYQVELAQRRYAEEVNSGRLVIAGCVYDFVNLYGKNRGRVILRNLNGETNPQKIRDSEVLQSLDQEILKQIIIM